MTGGGATIGAERFPGRQGRLLFAYLVAEQGRAIPRDDLAELLWAQSPPATWDKALTVLVSKLRVLLGVVGIDGASTLTNVSGCYQLDLPEGTSVDIVEAEQAAKAAAAALVDGELDRTVASAADALAVARRPFLPGSEGMWLDTKRRELGDLADEALAWSVDAHLAAGRPAEAVRLAQEAVALQPFRESGHRRLMQAHAAAGNRAEGLRAYDRCRRLLADELGAYPSPETDAIFQELLKQTRPAAPQPTAPRDVASSSRRRRTPLAAAAVGAAAIAVMVVLLAGGDDMHSPIGRNRLAVLDAASGRVSKSSAADRAYVALAAGDGALWAVDPGNSAVLKLDPGDGNVRDTIPVGSTPAAVAVGGGSVWVANAGDGTVSRVSAERGAAIQTIAVGNGPSALAFGAGGLWVAERLDSAVVLVDPVNGTVRATIPVPAAPASIAVAAGSVWVSGDNSASVFRIDPATHSVVDTINVGHGADALAPSANGVWVMNAGDGTISRIDAKRNAVTATTQVGGAPKALSATASAVWVARSAPAGLVKIDPASGRVLRNITMAAPPSALASLGPRLWLATGAAGRRGGTLTITASAEPTPTVDPALVYDGWKWGLMLDVYDGLVGYKRVAGPGGNVLVPDLARSVPAPSFGGLVYRFQLRPGMRYSDGTPVRAADVRWTIERVLRIGSSGAPYYSVIRGAGGCTKTSCNLSRGIITDDRRGTVVFHLSRPDPEFLTKLALPFAWVVRSSTPMRDVGIHPAAGTGPYRIASFVSEHRLVLARNPRFREWSADAQPAGNPDRIDMKIVKDEATAVSPASIDHTDLASGTPAPKRAPEILARYASRTRSYPLLGTWFVSLNTRAAPFDDVRVRRAVSYAVDRDRLVRAIGGPLLAEPACQVLPPGLLGYRPYCPYTRGSTRTGVWTGPDLSKARKLIAASGHRGSKVTLWAFPELAPSARIVVAALNRIGLHARAKVVGISRLFDAASDSRRHVQAATTPWIADYPSALGFLFNIFDCKAFQPASTANANYSQFCDRRSQAAMDRALAAETNDIGSAGRLWAAADRRITDAAPGVAFATPRLVNVISKRVHDYQYHPVWGPLLDQISLR
jgi:peptide/nickel transport system substrate-binding protein